MIYLKNQLFLIILKVSIKLGRNFHLKNKVFSSKRILEINFPKNESFDFIQVGANDGISFDFLFEFVTKRNSTGLVIEPVKDYFQELIENYKDYPKIIKINKAVHPSQKKIIINKISPDVIDKYPEWAKGIASLDIEHHKKVNIDTKDIIEEHVFADTLMNIVNQNYFKKGLDYFQTDTEGFDFNVIKMFDFDIFKPKIIKYESIHLKTKDTIYLENLLKNHGYFIFNENGDTVGVNLHKIKLY